MSSKKNCRDALTLALERGVAGTPEHGQWNFYNASPLPGLETAWKNAFSCYQGFRPEFLTLVKQGYAVSPEFSDASSGAGKGAVFILGRSRNWNEHWLARIWNNLKQGEALVVTGDKSGGIGSIRKWFGKHFAPVESFSKYHAIVFWAVKQGEDKVPIPEIEHDADGFLVEDGMFSSEGPDAASKLLTEHFDNRIRGKVADLGAGWGYLSAQALKSSDRIEAIDLYEAHHRSQLAAVKNLESFEVQKTFHWIDVTSEFPKKPYDWVIMNPPFHSGGRAAEPELGKRFIEVASSTLPSGGRLVMVANKNLPYEKTLEEKFRRYEKLAERDGFKVFEAVK